MNPDRTALAGFRKGNDRDLARRTGRMPDTEEARQSVEVDVDTLIAQRRATNTLDTEVESATLGQSPPSAPAPQARSQIVSRSSPTVRSGNNQGAERANAPADIIEVLQPKTVRTMNVPPPVLVGLRVLSAVRNKDHADLLMAAVAEYADSVAPAVVQVKRRRRMQTERLLVKLTADQTALIDRLAAERQMTRSTFITAVLGRFVSSDPVT